MLSAVLSIISTVKQFRSHQRTVTWVENMGGGGQKLLLLKYHSPHKEKARLARSKVLFNAVFLEPREKKKKKQKSSSLNKRVRKWPLSKSSCITNVYVLIMPGKRNTQVHSGPRISQLLESSHLPFRTRWPPFCEQASFLDALYRLSWSSFGLSWWLRC